MNLSIITFLFILINIFQTTPAFFPLFLHPCQSFSTTSFLPLLPFSPPSSNPILTHEVLRASTTDFGNDVRNSFNSNIFSNSFTFANDIASLPPLTNTERQLLAEGQRIQKQARSGRCGFGMVVVDVKAPVDRVFDMLTQFASYDKMIPTVKSVNIYSSSSNSNNDNEKTTIAEFSLSKFGLRVNVANSVIAEQRVIKFSLDPSRPNLVLRQADGFWFVQAPPDRPGYARVWLSANVVVSRIVPTMIVDYAAGRALPRATTWLRPFFEDHSGFTDMLKDDGC